MSESDKLSEALEWYDHRGPSAIRQVHTLAVAAREHASCGTDVNRSDDDEQIVDVMLSVDMEHEWWEHDAKAVLEALRSAGMRVVLAEEPK